MLVQACQTDRHAKEKTQNTVQLKCAETEDGIRS